MQKRRRNSARRSVCRVYALAISVLLAGPFATITGARQASSPAQKTPPALGTIKSISANQLVLATDNGSQITIQLPPDVKLVRVPPGSKDLKEATPIQLSDLQPGDRVLVQTKPGQEGTSLVATRVIAMKKTDIAEKQAKEREEWQKRGIGGLVKSVDAPNGTITIGVLTASGPKDVLVHTGKDTILRRYSPGSVKFDEAKTAPITEIHEGDQLRGRGTRSADGTEFTVDEIVSGSFRNIAGIISAVDASVGSLTVSDLNTKKQLEVKVTTDSQMRKLPQPMAQRIALRLKGGAADANAPAAAPGVSGQQSSTGNSPANAVQTGSANGNTNAGGPPRNGGGDLQQMLSRLPTSGLSDFQKGEAVMIVATSAQGDGLPTVITLLGGVEPILQSSTQGQAASILSPWSLSQAPGGGDAGTP